MHGTDFAVRNQAFGVLPGKAISISLKLALVVWLALAAAAQAQKETVLYSFAGGDDGWSPWSGLVRDAKGNLYGTTYHGGPYGYDGLGTVYVITKAGTEELLYIFTGGADGAGPIGPLVRDSSGNLYGTTAGGGTSSQGTVFMVSSGGVEKILHSFTGKPDGAVPWAGLVRDSKGNLYGTTLGGGASTWGTVFEITAGGVENVLYSFTGGADGGSPSGALVRDSKGNLYGTATAGGTSNGYGTVFKVTPKGVQTVLHTFTGGPADGAYPYGSLIRDSDNNLYGTTWEGGEHLVGTVFEVPAGGVEAVLHSFVPQTTNDGFYPYGGLVRDSKGNLYGATSSGGASAMGAVFQLTANGAEALLYSFSGSPDGAYPYLGSLVRDSKGNLYGTTQYGGGSSECFQGCGVVFKLAP